MLLGHFQTAKYTHSAAGGGPYPGGAKGPGDHLRNVFYRMGFNDQEIVALSGWCLLLSSLPLILPCEGYSLNVSTPSASAALMDD